MKKLVIIIVATLLSNVVIAQNINVTDYGAKANSFEDATVSIQKAIKACKEKSATHLIFEKGRYDFYPEKSEKRDLYISNSSSEEECLDKTKNIGLLFENMKGVTIEGNGSTFIFHGKMTSWSFINSENMELKNIIVDFERPTMSELTLLEVQPDYITTMIHPDSKYTIIDNKLYWYGDKWTMGARQHAVASDTVTGINSYSTFAPFQNAKAIEITPNLVRFEGEFSDKFTKGQILSIRNPVRDQVGAFVNLSKNIKLDNVVMHYMHGIGITSQFSENLDYNNVQIVPTHGRTIAAFADGMQFSGCKGHIKVNNSHFRGLHDDPINIHGTYLQIVKLISPTELLVEFKHHQTYGFNAFYEGDTISLVTKTAIESKGLSTIKSAKLISKKQMHLELTSLIPKDIKVEDCIENLTWTPSVEIRNSRFEGTNTRGILVTTPRKVVIDNNLFYRVGMHGILIAADVNSWFESGAVTDVTISNNTFIDCGHNLPMNSYAIAILPENKIISSKHWVHRNIKIQQNTFKVFTPQVLTAKSTNGLLFENNLVEYSQPENRGISLKRYDAPLFKFDNCTKTELKGNTYKLDKKYKALECVNMHKKDIKSDSF